ncbi:HlyD family efflux transporter periplasmic adaptor subunit [Desulfitobacterium sp. THU1]|uniref:efflux RND transporter periplasmic adaptor subunit n=1 Tax=Desulfitobacterium sp. THU1 TaxID=3138072 RepID=UPI00311DBF87
MGAKKRSQKLKWVTAGIIVIAIAVISVYFMRPTQLPYESTLAKTGDITTYYSFTGNVDTKNRQTVTADKMMQLSQINVSEGDGVKVGDILIKTTTGETLKAKIAGEVINLAAEEDAQIMPATKLLDIVDFNNLETKVKVDEYDLASVTVNKDATVRIDAINKEIKGKISSLSKEGQIANGVTFFTATVDLAKDANLKIGMTAEVKLLNNQATGVVTLPMAAIQFDDQNKPFILKKDATGAAVKTEIATGINDGTIVEIKDGVASEETILYPKATPAPITGFADGESGGRSRVER